MFTSKGKGPDLPPSASPDLGGTRRPPPSRAMTSIIANGVRIIGSLEADGAEVQIDGEIDGDIRGGSLTIGDTGMVKGNIISEAVLVNGRVEGSLRARKVQLARNAHVLGDIVHQSLSVEMGAVFEGQCKYLQDPLRDQNLGHSSSVDRSGADSLSSSSSPFGVGSGSVFGEPGPSLVTGTSG